MKFKMWLIFITFHFLASNGLSKHLEKKVNKEVITAFKVSQFDLKSKVFKETLPAPFEDNLYEIIDKEQLLGYAYIGKAPSKTDTFDFLILFDLNFVIKKTKVLIYREDYGGEIGSHRWLKQFSGKSMISSIKYESDIVGISGATISVRSMTQAVNDVLKSLKILHSKNLL